MPDPVFAPHDRWLGFVLMFTDLTERKTAETARKRFQQGVLEQHRPMSGRLDSKADLVFRNLLSTMVENAQLAALATRERPPDGPHRVAVRRLDLHDLGAEIGHQHRRVGAGQEVAQVQDLEALQGVALRGRPAVAASSQKPRRGPDFRSLERGCCGPLRAFGCPPEPAPHTTTSYCLVRTLAARSSIAPREFAGYRVAAVLGRHPYVSDRFSQMIVWYFSTSR